MKKKKAVVSSSGEKRQGLENNVAGAFSASICIKYCSSSGDISARSFCKNSSAACWVMLAILACTCADISSIGKYLYSIADVTSIRNIFRDTSALVLPSPKQRGNIQVGGAKAGNRRANTGTVKYGLGWCFWSKYGCGEAVVKQTHLPPPVPPTQKPVTEPPFYYTTTPMHLDFIIHQLQEGVCSVHWLF